MHKSISTREIKISESDLPFACPPPNTPKWNMHPRVFIQLSHDQPVKSCPYCGARYRLMSEEKSNNNE